MHLRIVTYAFRPGEPPTELQLWSVGENPTDYGVHLWTERSKREVLGVYAARGNPLQIDVEHNAAEPPKAEDEPPVGGGYARLELRNGAPWLVFDWSEYAIDQIRTRQRLFLSPEYDVDKQTKEIVRLVRVSLVADPGTHHARMLATAARRRVRAGGNQMDFAIFLAALKAAVAGDNPEASVAQITSLIGQVEQMAGTGDGGGAAAAAGADDGMQAAAPPDGGAAGGAPPQAAGDDDKKKQEAARAAAAAARASSAASVALGASGETIAIAARLGTIEAANKALKTQNDALLERLDAGERVEAAGARIPESLRVFARGLSKAQFDLFVEKLPEVTEEQATRVATGAGGVRAAARPARGDVSGRPGGALPPEDQKAMDRIFNTNARPESSVEELPNGRVRLTHLARPKPVATNGG